MADDEHQADQEPTASQEAQAPAQETPLAEPMAGGSEAGGRLGELMAKRRGKGLTDSEAEELGKLLAEQEGQPHTSALSLKQASAEGA
jgi:hypothetical protein